MSLRFTFLALTCAGSLLAAGGGCAPPQPSGPAAPSAKAPVAAPTSTSGGAPEPSTAAGATPAAQAVPAGAGRPALVFPRRAAPWFGVELKANEPERPGALISLVFPGSPAARAGVTAGDVVLSIDGAVIQGPGDVAPLVQKKRAGDSLGVLLLRGGASRLLRVELEGTPEFEDRVRLAFVGRPAPEISGVTTFQGDTSALADVRGRVVVLEFWASWCGPCRYVSPVLDRWYRLYKPQGAEVIGITVDSPADGFEVAQHTGMSYTLAHDPAGRTSRSYMASEVPLLILIDKKGVVREVLVGASQERLQLLEKTLQQLLGEPG